MSGFPQRNIGLLHSNRLTDIDSCMINSKDFVLVRDKEEAQQRGCVALLIWQDDKLALQSLHETQLKPFSVDWGLGKSDYRRKHGGGRGEMIAKAVGIKKDFLPDIVDSTAGLGQDSFVLASLGCKVRLIERSPAIRALLWDGLRRAQQDDEIGIIARRMELIGAEAVEYLGQLNEMMRPDVVYCDPMFPERKKTALVKKEMRIFKEVVGNDNDAVMLLVQALETANKRVVVKRPRKAPIIDGPQPSHCVEGRTSRFDVYMINH